MTRSVLDRIREYKLEDLARRKSARPIAGIEAVAKSAPPTRGFADALRWRSRTGYGLICEIKKASPSRGLIREDFDPPALAKAFEGGGAACLSVLTDEPSFQGADRYLTQARSATDLPVLRKDFMYDPYQVAEARALHADCILIIMASVSDAQALELEDAAHRWGMDALMEVHNEEEMERATRLKSRLIGINNRDLRTFRTELETTRRLSRLAPPGSVTVSESGLDTPEDLADMARHGVRSFLIGESLMRQHDVAAATMRLLADPVIRQGAT